MEFKTLTKHNAAAYLGRPIVFELSGKPRIAKLRQIEGRHLVISSMGKDFLLSVTHPVVVVIDNNQPRSTSATNPGAAAATDTLHYPMNFLPASNATNVLQYLGHYVILRTDKGRALSLAKIKTISSSLQHIHVENRTSKRTVDIRHTPCYIIV